MRYAAQRQVMQRAHQIRKSSNFSKSEYLKLAWKEYKSKEVIVMTETEVKENFFIGTHAECVEQAKKQGWTNYFPISYLNDNQLLNTDSPIITGKAATNEKGEYLFKIDMNLKPDYKLSYVFASKHMLTNEEIFEEVYIDDYTNSHRWQEISKEDAKKRAEQGVSVIRSGFRDYKFAA